MMKKDEEKKRKEEKDKLNQQQKEERKQLYLKQQAQKETEEVQKAEKNPFSVFAEKNGEEVMGDDSVVFTEQSSSDHLPKGTLSRLPLT